MKVIKGFIALSLLFVLNIVYAMNFFHVEPEDGKAWLIHEIDRAGKFIDLTIYEMSDRDILSALSRAKGRGVNVKVLLNHFRDRRHNKVMAVETNFLSSAGAAYEFAAPAFPFTHEKCLVIDGREAIVMSFNLEADYFKTTRDFAVITTNSEDVKEIIKVFESDWGFNKASNIEDRCLIWSPDTARRKLTGLIASAKTAIDIYNEEIRDENIINLLEAAAGKGIKIRFMCPVLKEKGVDGNLEGAEKLSEAGAGVKEVMEGFNRLYIHAKVIIIDRKAAFIGSINFSKYSIDRNRELGIIVMDPEIIRRLEDVFNRDWDSL